MQAGQWYRVVNGPEAEIWPYLVKPDVRTCNSFVICTPTHLFVIDPGGTREQSEEVFALVRAELQKKARPVYVCLTHCHVDHALGFVAWSADNSLPGLSVVCHEAGMKAWQRADRDLTQADILEQAVVPWMHPGMRVISPGKRNRKGPPDFCIENQLEVLLAPGHGPDCVCYRMGEVLFVGDLLLATAPLVAGVKGWNRGELVQSLKNVSGFVKQAGIEWVGPGHGGILDRATLTKILGRAVHETEQMPEVEVVDASRVQAVSAQARELFEELLRMFGVIQARIERLAQRLQSLEETSAARHIRDILDSEQVIALLGEFRLFEASLKSGAIIAVQLALKSVQIVPRILRLLEFDRLKEVLDPALLRYTRLLLTDFLNTAKGLRVEDEKSPLELSAWVHEFVQELNRRPAEGLTSEDVPDDEDGFRNHLIRMIAHVPRFEAVHLEARGGSGQVRVQAAPERLHDTLKRLLEICVEVGAGELDLAVSPAELAVRTRFPGSVPRLEPARWQGCARSLALAGAALRAIPSGQGFDFQMHFA